MKKVLKFLGWIVVIIAVLAAIVMLFSIGESRNNAVYKSMLLEIPNCELVRVEYGEKNLLVGCSTAAGYMEREQIEAFTNSAISYNVKVYHPYEKDQYVLINTDEIHSILTYTKEEFVSKYKPY